MEKQHGKVETRARKREAYLNVNQRIKLKNGLGRVCNLEIENKGHGQAHLLAQRERNMNHICSYLTLYKHC